MGSLEVRPGGVWAAAVLQAGRTTGEKKGCTADIRPGLNVEPGIVTVSGAGWSLALTRLPEVYDEARRS